MTDASPEHAWQATRARYTWHLRPPFNDEFDRSHWWKHSKAEPEPVPALYELARRHPLVGEARLRVRKANWYGRELGDGPRFVADLSGALADLKQEPAAVICLCLIGLRSWPTLKKLDQQLWSDTIGKMKGVDSRSAPKVCFCLPSTDLETVMWGRDVPKPTLRFLAEQMPPAAPARIRRRRKMPLSQSVAELQQTGQKSLFVDPLESRIAELAVDAHRQGLVLIAVAPDLTQDRAEALLAKTYKERQKVPATTKELARCGNWLDLIVDFEQAASTEKGAEAPIFNHYRRAMDGIRFR